MIGAYTCVDFVCTTMCTSNGRNAWRFVVGLVWLGGPGLITSGSVGFGGFDWKLGWWVASIIHLSHLLNQIRLIIPQNIPCIRIRQKILCILNHKIFLWILRMNALIVVLRAPLPCCQGAIACTNYTCECIWCSFRQVTWFWFVDCNFLIFYSCTFYQEMPCCPRIWYSMFHCSGCTFCVENCFWIWD